MDNPGSRYKRLADGVIASQHFVFRDRKVDPRVEDSWYGPGRLRAIHRLSSLRVNTWGYQPVWGAAILTDRPFYALAGETVTVLVIDPQQAREAAMVEVRQVGVRQVGLRGMRTVLVSLDVDGVGAVQLGPLGPGVYRFQGERRQTSELEVVPASPGALAALKISRLWTDRPVYHALAPEVVIHVVAPQGRAAWVPLWIQGPQGKNLWTGVLLDAQGSGVLRWTKMDPGEYRVLAPWLQTRFAIEPPTWSESVSDPGWPRRSPDFGTLLASATLPTATLPRATPARAQPPPLPAEPHWISNLGPVFRISPDPAPGAREWRGRWIVPDGRRESPVVLEDPLADRARLRIERTVESVLIFQITADGKFQCIEHERWTAGDTVELPATKPFTTFVIGGFVDGVPWEGEATVFPPPSFGLELAAPECVAPDQPLRFELKNRTRRPRTRVFLSVQPVQPGRPADPEDCLADNMVRELAHRRAQARRTLEEQHLHVKIDHALERARLLSRDQLADVGAGFFGGSPSVWGLGLDPAVVARFLAETMGIELVESAGVPVDAAALALVSAESAWYGRTLPLREADGELVVLSAEPASRFARARLEELTGMTVRFAVAAPAIVDELIERHYGARPGERREAPRAVEPARTPAATRPKGTEPVQPSSLEVRDSDPHGSARSSDYTLPFPYAGLARIDGTTTFTVPVPEGVRAVLIDAFAMEGSDTVTVRARVSVEATDPLRDKEQI